MTPTGHGAGRARLSGRPHRQAQMILSIPQSGTLHTDGAPTSSPPRGPLRKRERGAGPESPGCPHARPFGRPARPLSGGDPVVHDRMPERTRPVGAKGDILPRLSGYGGLSFTSLSGLAVGPVNILGRCPPRSPPGFRPISQGSGGRPLASGIHVVLVAHSGVLTATTAPACRAPWLQVTRVGC